MMTARKVSFIRNVAQTTIHGTALATVLALGASLISVKDAQAQSVIVNYSALDQLDDAAPASQPVNPSSYATGQGYPFQPTPAPTATPYPAPSAQMAPAPMAAPAAPVQTTTTYAPAPSMQGFPAPGGTEGYNRIMILGSPKMAEEARRTGKLPYSSGTLQYRQELANMVGAGASAHPVPTPNAAPDYSRQELDRSAGELPRRIAAYSRADRPAPVAKQNNSVLETTDGGLPRRVAAAPSAYHKSPDGLVRRVSAKSGTMGVTRELLQQASQTPTGLPPLLVIKFQQKEQDLTSTDRNSLTPVMRQLDTQNSRFEVIGFASDTDGRVARKRSLDRTMAVRNFMIENGIPADRIKIRARGAEPTRSGQVHDQVIIGGE